MASVVDSESLGVGGRKGAWCCVCVYEVVDAGKRRHHPFDVVGSRDVLVWFKVDEGGTLAFCLEVLCQPAADVAGYFRGRMAIER